MKCIFLDDERNPKDVTWLVYPEFIKDWIIIRSYDEAVRWIAANGLPDFISFDNDLGTDKEGKDVVKHIIAYCIDNEKEFPLCAVHSKNPIAADNMVNLIQCFNRLKDF